MRTIDARFESGSEGFSTTGLALGAYQPDGGRPDGYFQYTDLGLFDVNYYQASDEFTGHKLAFFRGELSYKIFDSGSDLAGEADVKLVGQDGVTLVATVGQAQSDWSKMGIALDTDGGWRIGSLDGPLASNSDIKHVLKDLNQILVRADYSTGLDSGGLDDLKLKTAPQHGQAPQQTNGAMPAHAFADHAALGHGGHADMVGHPALSLDHAHIIA